MLCQEDLRLITISLRNGNASTAKTRVQLDASPLDNQRLCHIKQSVQGSTHNITVKTGSLCIPWVAPQMATWRITGFVPDSEDEDDEIDLNFRNHQIPSQSQRRKLGQDEQSQPENAATSNNDDDLSSEPSAVAISADDEQPDVAEHGNDQEESSTPTSLATEGNQVLNYLLPLSQNHLTDTVDEHVTTRYLLSPTKDFFKEVADDLDSPLTTPPASPLLALDHGSPVLASRPGQELLAASTNTVGRNFRPRKAIQINPYLLDLAKHQKEWGERGLKPVHIPRAHSPQRREQETESQEFASHDESQVSVNLLQASMDINASSLTNQAASFDLDGTLPEIDDLIRQDIGRQHQVYRPKKRVRRDGHPVSAPADVFDLPSNSEAPEQRKKPRIQLPTIRQDSFPSPPRSGSLSVNDPFASSRSETGESPDLLTPAASTGLRIRRWRHVIEDESQSQNGEEEQHASISSDASDQSSGTESETEVVRVMQKRLRGVIPASYLTVQRAQQAASRKRNETAKGMPSSTSGPGVAQRKLNKSTYRTNLENTTSRWYDELASEEEDTPLSPNRDVSQHGEAENELLDRPDLLLPDSEDVEAAETMEDAGIDHMLPARPRTQNTRHKRSRSSTYSMKATTGHRQRLSSHRDPVEHISRPKQRTKRTVPKSAVHLLNAPGLSLDHVDRPPWLRIAARRARRTGTPSISAGRKFFQLDSPEETAAARRVLHERAHESMDARNHTNRRELQPDAPRQNRERVSRDPFTPAKSGHQSRPARWPSALFPRKSSDNSNQQDALDDDHQQSQTEPAQINRLISLLSRKNRAGRGRLVNRATEPRSAQIEEVQQGRRALARASRPSHAALPLHRIIPIAERDHPTSNSRNGAEMSHSDNCVPQPSMLPQPKPRGTLSKKKQVPVYRPKVRQTLLAPLILHTEKLYALIGQTGPDVRAELEREFVAHQAEWFQGRRDGIVCANEATQRHFQVFLEVLRSYLSAVSKGASEFGDVRGLRSFLYRLVPNRGSIGAQGQVGDKSMDMVDFDILVARNVFDLHVCLLNLAPAYAPLPRVLETKVNFADAHNEICLIAIAAWQAVCSHHHTQQSIIDGLCGWLYLIMTQLLSRWRSAESDARAEAECSVQRIEERVIRKVIEHNRAQTSELLLVVLRALACSVEDALTVSEAMSLLSIDRYTEFVVAMARLPHISSDVPAAMFQVALSYANQWLGQCPAIITPLLSSLRQAISALTSHSASLSIDTRNIMTRAFFAVARIAVSQRQRSWDDFVALTSSFSFNMFLSDKFIDSSKALFYQDLVDTEPDVYRIDFRAVIMSHWLRVLLQSRDTEAAVGLTRSVFDHEKNSLDMPSLVATFHAPGTTIPNTAIRDNIVEIRVATILHVIAELSGQENNAEAEWLPGGLDESDGVQLLKIIFSTMKESWMSLSERHEEQDKYTDLIHAALDQYEVHGRSDFQVEAWFYNSIMIPQRRKRSLVKVLAQQSCSDASFIQDSTEVMQQEIIHAKRTDNFEELKTDLKSLLLPGMTENGMLPQSSINKVDMAARHCVFIREVLLPLTKHDAAISGLALEVLAHLTSSLECRIPAHEGTIFGTVTDTFMEAIMVLSAEMDSLEADTRANLYAFTLVTFEMCMTTVSLEQNGFLDSIAHICDWAMQDDSMDGIALLEAVLSRG